MLFALLKTEPLIFIPVWAKEHSYRRPRLRSAVRCRGRLKKIDKLESLSTVKLKWKINVCK